MEANQMKDIEALQSDYLVTMEVFVLCSADQSLSWVSVCLWAAYGHNREKYNRMTTLNRLIVPDVQACIVLKRQQAVIKNYECCVIAYVCNKCQRWWMKIKFRQTHVLQKLSYWVMKSYLNLFRRVIITNTVSKSQMLCLKAINKWQVLF